jgi:hypothetical protein
LPAFICAFDAAIENGRERRSSAGGRQVLHLDARRLHEKRRRQMERAVEARGAEDQLVRPLLGVGNELLERLVRLRVVDDQNHRVGDEARDRNEIIARELDRPAKQLVDLGEAGDRHDMHEQRIAVGLGVGRELAADLARGAGLGLDDERLLQNRLEHRGERARDDVDRAAGRKRIDEGDRPGRVSLLGERRLDGECGGGRRRADDEVSSIHLVLLRRVRRRWYRNIRT